MLRNDADGWQRDAPLSLRQANAAFAKGELLKALRYSDDAEVVVGAACRFGSTGNALLPQIGNANGLTHGLRDRLAVPADAMPPVWEIRNP